MYKVKISYLKDSKTHRELFK